MKTFDALHVDSESLIVGQQVTAEHVPLGRLSVVQPHIGKIKGLLVEIDSHLHGLIFANAGFNAVILEFLAYLCDSP